MKVLMTADCVGGVWTYALELARALAAAGDDVVLAVMGAPLTGAQRDELDTAPLAAWEARPYKLEWMPAPEEDLRAASAWLRELADRHQPDLVHLNQFNFAADGWSAPVVVVGHSDVVSWWRAVHGCDPPPEWDAYRARVAAGLSSAHAVVTPTRAVLRDLRDAYEVRPATHVIANGRSLTVPPFPKEPRIVASGRLDDAGKNAAAAARAASGLPWRLVVAGSAAEDRDEFVGRLEAHRFVDVLCRSQIFVEPARYEPFGLAALEAGLAGCALVLGDIASLREVWGDAALFVAPDDAAALRDALQSLIDDPDLLRSRQRAAAARARRFDTATMAASYRRLYAGLAPAARDRVRT